MDPSFSKRDPLDLATGGSPVSPHEDEIGRELGASFFQGYEYISVWRKYPNAPAFAGLISNRPPYLTNVWRRHVSRYVETHWL